MGKIRRALGLMSGTSMDGIDIALIETDGENHVRRLAAGGWAYEPAFRERLRAGLRDALDIEVRTERPGDLATIEAELTRLHAETVLRFVGDRTLQPSAIDVIGFHGQTVLHAPEKRLTVQIGDGPALAAATGIDVVHDLRAADCAAGGQGAPLAPVYHRALAAKAPERPVAFVNIGGVANITWIGADGSASRNRSMSAAHDSTSPTETACIQIPPGFVSLERGGSHPIRSLRLARYLRFRKIRPAA